MKRTIATVIVTGALCASAFPQDLAVSRIGGTGGDFAYYGQSGGIASYSFGTTSCNVGDKQIEWVSGSSGRHPVIGQNFFRIDDHRIVQLGQSWLKHGFCAVNEDSCGTCQGTPCDTLGIGCADTYSSSLNDGQGGGAKSDIDPTTGDHAHPVTTPSSGGSTLRGRLQVPIAELGVAGSVYVAEGQYVSEHDQLAGYVRNNTSWRRIDTSSIANVFAVGGTQMNNPAIYAWKLYDPGAEVVEVVNVDEGGTGVHGWFFVGYHAVDLLDGRWRYEYAVQNMSSGRSAGSFAIPVPCEDATITDVSFRDVGYHSGEIYDGTDWVATVGRDEVRWEATTTWAQNPNGNAIRWGTLYNFGFTCDRAPQAAVAELGLYVPGTPSLLTAMVEGPCGTPPCGIVNYCEGAPNSFNPGGGLLLSNGSVSIAANDLMLIGSGMPPSQSALLFYGAGATQFGFGDGFMCVTPPHFRLLRPATTNVFGEAFFPLDNTQGPMGSGPGAVSAGETWYWQVWYRDPAAGASGFNTTDGAAITFCP